MRKNSGLRLTALAALMVSGSASAAVITTNFITSNAALIDIYSTTLDNGNNTVLANNNCNSPVLTGNALQECQFFNGVPTAFIPANRKIIIAQNGFGSGLSTGTLNVDWEDTTGEIIKVNSLILNYQDLIINIAAVPSIGFPSPAVATVTQGNGQGLFGPVADDQGRSTASADLDTGPAIGQASIFQGGADGGPVDNPDFSVFNDIVDSCVATGTGNSACGLLGLLSIDGDKYRIDGLLSASGGSFTLRAQTGNNSIYTSTFDAAVVPAPPAAWLLLTGLGALIGRRFRNRQQRS